MVIGSKSDTAKIMERFLTLEFPLLRKATYTTNKDNRMKYRLGR
jgi:hypothetical protein